MKKAKHLMLDEKIYNYLQEVKEKNYLSSLSKALEKVVTEHKDYDRAFIKAIGDEVFSRLKVMQFAIRSADKNSQIALLMLNQLLLDSVSTRYSEKLSSQYIASEKIVTDRISSLRTSKLNREKKLILQTRAEISESEEDGSEMI